MGPTDRNDFFCPEPILTLPVPLSSLAPCAKLNPMKKCHDASLSKNPSPLRRRDPPPPSRRGGRGGQIQAGARGQGLTARRAARGAAEARGQGPAADAARRQVEHTV
jgi:hypothetical protein